VGAVIAGAPVSYTSSAPSVFSVSPAGLVTSLGPDGSGTISVTSGTVTVKVGVFVGTAPQGTIVHTTTLGGAPYAAAIAPSGAVVITLAGTSSIARGDLPGFDFPTTIDVGVFRPLGIALSPSGGTAYVALPNRIAVVDLASNTAGTPIAPSGFVEFLSVVSGGGVLYAGSSGRLYSIDPVTRQPVDSAEFFGALHLALHPTQPLLYASGGAGVSEINTTTMDVVRSFPAGGGNQAVAVSPDGTELYVANEYGGGLGVFSLATGQKVQTVPLAAGGFGLAVTGSLIVVAEGGRVEIFDRASRVLLSTVLVGGTPRRPAINAAGNLIVVPNEDGFVSFIQ
jgi:DNA-binding beta-propeller fold protein YncE